MNETQGHFKFIKRSKDWLDPGDYLPDFAGSPVHIGIKLDPRSRSCLFLFFIDTECEPCGDGLNTLYKILSEYDLPVTILVSTPDTDKFEVLKDAFDGMADVYRYSLKEMRAHFRTGATPWGYGINSVGQIITSSVCGNRAEFLRLVHPFRSLIGEVG